MSKLVPRVSRKDILAERERTSWSSRIPAAIAKSEKITALQREFPGTYFVAQLNATEVALAKALWAEEEGDSNQYSSKWIPSQALRDFTEKVESLE